MDSNAPARSVGGSFEEFVALIARLRAPGGCPWDREQTHASLKPMTIEEAYEVPTKASRVGCDWPDAAAVLAKLDEEVAELREAVEASGGRAAADARVAEEVGDLLFSAVNVARLLGHDPESTLKAANRKFR